MCCKLQKKKITFNEITGLHIQLQQKIFNVRCAGAIAGNCDIKSKKASNPSDEKKPARTAVKIQTEILSETAKAYKRRKGSLRISSKRF